VPPPPPEVLGGPPTGQGRPSAGGPSHKDDKGPGPQRAALPLDRPGQAGDPPPGQVRPSAGGPSPEALGRRPKKRKKQKEKNSERAKQRGRERKQRERKKTEKDNILIWVRAYVNPPSLFQLRHLELML